MSAPGVDFTDPQLSAFFASDPARQLEQAPAEPAPSRPRLSRARAAELAVAIAAAFLVVRRLIANDMASQPPPDDVSGAAAALWRRHAPTWLRLVVPALLHAYALGDTAMLSQAELEAMATSYAQGLGEYVNSTSAQALAEGFNAQLAQRWSERVAWQRASAAYGLDRQGMLSHVSALMKSSEDGGRELVSEAARALVDKALMLRADTIGQNEAWRSIQSGKAIAWLLQQQAGAIGPEAMKEWDTARGESPCEICGPLNGVAVSLDASFDSSEGPLFAPGAHPNCRCELRLRLAEPIRKDMPGDPHDRDRQGRFARQEQRRKTPPPQAAVAERDPVIEEILRQAREIADQPVDPFARTASPADPFARTGGPSANPFARTGDPFARTPGADPFARVGRKAQGSLAERRRSLAALRRRPRPGSRSRATADVTRHVIILPAMPARESASHDPYYLPAYELNDMLHNQNVGGEFFDTIDEPSFEQGDTVDFTRHIAEATYFWETRRDWIAGMETEATAEGSTLQDYANSWGHETFLPGRPQAFVAAASSDFTHLADDSSEDLDYFFGDRTRLVKATRNEALANVESVVDQLDHQALITITYLVGLTPRPTTGDAKAAIVEAVQHDPTLPLAAAYADYVAYCEPELSGANGEDLARELRSHLSGHPSYPHVPEIFVFDRGFAPGDAEKGHGSLVDIKGEYEVEEVEYHSAAVLGSEGPAGVSGYRLVYLRPAE